MGNHLDIDPAKLRAFAHRDWDAPARLRRARADTRTPQERVAVAIELYEGARRTRPSWPTRQDRLRDLDALLAFLDRLRAV